MIKIRNSVFETNSSSVHAICISSKPINDTNGLSVTLHIGEFGWEHEWYQDIDSRASYIYTLACHVYGKDFYNCFKEMLEPYGINVWRDFDNFAKFVNYGDNDYYLNNGYVDHGGELQEFIDRCLDDPDVLIRFIFGEESFVMTTNDNCDYDEEETKAIVEAGNNELIWKWN